MAGDHDKHHDHDAHVDAPGGAKGHDHGGHNHAPPDIHHDLEDRFGIHHITLQLEDCRDVQCAQASPESL